jgi:hypothetical protein
MTETIKFVDGVTYSEADQSEWNMRVERPQGIFLDSGLGVLGTTAPGGMLVRVTPGHAMIRGFLYANDANKDVVIAANASGSARIDTVVLRLVPTSNICTALVVQGTPGAGAPSLIQVVGGTWDFPLCDVAVANGAASILAGNLADRRVYSYWPANTLDPLVAMDSDLTAMQSILQTNINTVQTNLNTEATTRGNADSTLSGRVTTLETRKFAGADIGWFGGGILTNGVNVASLTYLSVGKLRIIFTATMTRPIWMTFTDYTQGAIYSFSNVTTGPPVTAEIWAWDTSHAFTDGARGFLLAMC